MSILSDEGEQAARVALVLACLAMLAIVACLSVSLWHDYQRCVHPKRIEWKPVSGKYSHGKYFVLLEGTPTAAWIIKEK